MKNCDACEGNRYVSSMKLGKIWICGKCMEELYQHFKGFYYVKRLNTIMNKIEKYLDKIYKRKFVQERSSEPDTCVNRHKLLGQIFSVYTENFRRKFSSILK